MRLRPDETVEPRSLASLADESICAPVTYASAAAMDAVDPLVRDAHSVLARARSLNSSTLVLEGLGTAVEEFIALGGSFAIAPSSESEDDVFRPKGGFRVPITERDVVLPVCHAGQSRSQTMMMCLRAVKHTLGVPPGRAQAETMEDVCAGVAQARGDRTVAPPHGASNGFDAFTSYRELADGSDFELLSRYCPGKMSPALRREEAWMRAFGNEPKLRRAGHGAALDKDLYGVTMGGSCDVRTLERNRTFMHEWFSANYFRRQPRYTDRRVTFFAFTRAAVIVTQRLVEAARAMPLPSCEGFRVVLLPYADSSKLGAQEESRRQYHRLFGVLGSILQPAIVAGGSAEPAPIATAGAAEEVETALGNLSTLREDGDGDSGGAASSKPVCVDEHEGGDVRRELARTQAARDEVRSRLEDSEAKLSTMSLVEAQLEEELEGARSEMAALRHSKEALAQERASATLASEQRAVAFSAAVDELEGLRHRLRVTEEQLRGTAAENVELRRSGEEERAKHASTAAEITRELTAKLKRAANDAVQATSKASLMVQRLEAMTLERDALKLQLAHALSLGHPHHGGDAAAALAKSDGSTAPEINESALPLFTVVSGAFAGWKVVMVVEAEDTSAVRLAARGRGATDARSVGEEIVIMNSSLERSFVGHGLNNAPPDHRVTGGIYVGCKVRMVDVSSAVSQIGHTVSMVELVELGPFQSSDSVLGDHVRIPDTFLQRIAPSRTEARTLDDGTRRAASYEEVSTRSHESLSLPPASQVSRVILIYLASLPPPRLRALFPFLFWCHSQRTS